ncbi:hypothetical protein QJS66_12310 [Kocuria rhizophila]|nr:hypothetical protein QJS66_12310 [Kocuria rhizophila]
MRKDVLAAIEQVDDQRMRTKRRRAAHGPVRRGARRTTAGLAAAGGPAPQGGAGGVVPSGSPGTDSAPGWIASQEPVKGVRRAQLRTPSARSARESPRPPSGWQWTPPTAEAALRAEAKDPGEHAEPARADHPGSPWPGCGSSAAQRARGHRRGRLPDRRAPAGREPQASPWSPERKDLMVPNLRNADQLSAVGADQRAMREIIGVTTPARPARPS